MYGMTTRIPPLTDARFVLQRADDVSAVLRMLGGVQINTVVLTGESGAGKSTLAALVYRQLSVAAQEGALPFRYFAWVSPGYNASLPDCLAVLLESLDAGMALQEFMLLKPEQQLSFVLHLLRRAGQGSLVVFDQVEELLDLETGQVLPGRGAVSLFFEMLQQDLGSSRVILTCPRSPFGAQSRMETRTKAYLVSRVSMPEGVALLSQRGVQGSSQELSLVWQRCAGNIYGLILFAALSTLSGFSLSYLLNSPDYQFMWRGDVILNLLNVAYNFLNPIQRTLLRALCLFNEPVYLEGMMAAISGESGNIDAQAFERELLILLKLGLAQQVPGERKPRYFLHARVRQYTIEHYLEGHERRSNGRTNSAVGVAFEPNPFEGNQEARDIALAAGHMRVAGYYAYLSKALCPPPDRRSSVQDAEPLISVIQHMCLGCHWQHAYDVLLQENLHETLVEWGAWNTLIRLYTGMISPHGFVTRPDEAFICAHLGLLYGRLSDYQASAWYYQQALRIQQELGDLHGQATTLVNKGELMRESNNFLQARACFQEAGRLLASQPDERLERALLHNLGLLSQDEKDYEQALKYYQESLKLAQNQDDLYSQGLILTNTGMLLFELGRLSDALSLLTQALKLRQEANDVTVGTLVQFLHALEQSMAL
jgi:tetratricopeptide (TPR) repeat protein